MPKATIAVRGSASGEIPADFAGIHFQHHYRVPARSEALSHGNAVVVQLREVAAQSTLGIREMKVHTLRVEEVFNPLGPDHIPQPSGWSSQVTGEASVETGNVPEAVAALTKVGVSISHISWHLETETDASARRRVRRLAVADAVEAAQDFADALGGSVGDLITLADPGLLGAGAFATSAHGPTRASTHFAAAASSMSTWDERVDIDPSTITIAVSVEASYEVNFRTASKGESV